MAPTHPVCMSILASACLFCMITQQQLNTALPTAACGMHKAPMCLCMHGRRSMVQVRHDAQEHMVLTCQLQSKRLRWLGHVFRMPDNRLPKKLLFGQVKGRRPAGLGRPRLSYNALVLEGCYSRNFCNYYSDAQNKPFWRDKSGSART